MDLSYSTVTANFHSDTDRPIKTDSRSYSCSLFPREYPEFGNTAVIIPESAVFVSGIPYWNYVHRYLSFKLVSPVLV
eukprot:4053080-Pyramimonas_sp.AAC.1